jgi:hypothetical protein
VTPRRQDDPEEDVRPPGFSRRGTRALEVAENLVYGGIALFLVLSAFVLLGVAGKTSLGLLSDFSEEFDDRILEIGLLGGLVVLLGVTSYLLRRKEREPDEGEPAPGRLSVG